MLLDSNWLQDYINDLHNQWVECVEILTVDPRVSDKEKRKLSAYLAEEDRAWRGEARHFDEEFKEESSILSAMETMEKMNDMD